MKYKWYLFLGLIGSWILSACSNDLGDTAFENDEQAVNQYVAENNLVGTKTSIGIFHSVREEGNGTSVRVDDIVVINYELFLPSGQRIGGDEGYTFRPQTGSFLYGFTEGVMEMTEGEKATLVIPSIAGFGAQSFRIGSVTVPANSILVAEVELKELRTNAEQLAVESAQIEQVLTEGNLTWERTEEGLYYVQLEEGVDETLPQVGQYVMVDYEGTLLDSTRFDEGSGFIFQVGTSQIIKGWNIGIQRITRGETALWYLPSALAYQDRGSGPQIGPFTPLVFRVSLQTISE